MKNPLVSICIPTYNSERYISLTLESILSQTYKNLEIIVSDNCSTDNTIEIVKKFVLKDYRIKLSINKTNLGFSANSNALINLASSEFIAIFHSDDIYDKNIIHEQLEFLSLNPNLAGCFTLGKMINDKGRIIRNRFFLNKTNTKNNIVINFDSYIRNLFIFGGSSFICPTAFIRKSIYNSTGLYNENLRFIEDQDMYLRILENHDMGIISKELIHYRVHFNQGSAIYKKPNQNLSVVAEHIKDYFEKKNEKYFIYRNQYNEFIAKSYLRAAKNNALFNDYVLMKINISKSKKYFVFRNNLLFYLIQNMDKFLIRIVIVLITRIRMSLRIF
jgi:glycosyltransferase involved in cell wall biosynthesis